MDFDNFVIAQPDSTAVTLQTPQQTTQCLDAQFQATSDGHATPIICGTNTGQHMFLEAKDDCNELAFSWNDNTAVRSWKVKISQIECSDPNKPPSGCTQYYTGDSGTFQSYNWNNGNGPHLASQDYQICFRQEKNSCKINFFERTIGSDFQISHEAGITNTIGDICSRDYLIIPGGRSESNSIGEGHDRYCGAALEVLTASSPDVYTMSTVTMGRVPFQIRVVFDGGEMGSNTDSMKDTLFKGFSLGYMQQSTSCENSSGN